MASNQEKVEPLQDWQIITIQEVIDAIAQFRSANSNCQNINTTQAKASKDTYDESTDDADQDFTMCFQEIMSLLEDMLQSDATEEEIQRLAQFGIEVCDAFKESIERSEIEIVWAQRELEAALNYARS